MVKFISKNSVHSIPEAATGCEEVLNATFGSLADPTRRAIITRLSQGECSVNELAQPFDISLPAVSKHLRVLERSGILQQHKQGRVRRCQLNAQPLEQAAHWVEQYRQFWDHQLDALADYLNNNHD